MCQLFENVKNGDSDASPCQNMREIGRQTDYWESNSFIMVIFDIDAKLINYS